MEKKEYLYHFIDTYTGDNSDLSFLICSTAKPEIMEKIEQVAELIWNYSYTEEETFDDPIINKLYHKYFEDYKDTSKIEIIQCITRDEGYSWNEPDIIEINW